MISDSYLEAGRFSAALYLHVLNRVMEGRNLFVFINPFIKITGLSKI